MIIECNKCKKKFKNKLYKKIEKINDENVYVYFLKCKHCNQKYLAFCKNDKVNDLHKKAEELRKNINCNEINNYINNSIENEEYKKIISEAADIMKKLEKSILEKKGIEF